MTWVRCYPRRWGGADQARSGNGEFSVRAARGVVEGEDDVFFWDPCANQVFGDAQVCSVVLEPDLSVDHVDMKENLIDAVLTLPSDLTDVVMPECVIADELRSNTLFGRGHGSDFLQDALYNG